MKNELSAKDLVNLVETTKRVAEDKKRQASSIAAFESAKQQIKERGQFIPKEIKSEMPTITF